MTLERRTAVLYDGTCGFCTRSIEIAVARLPRSAEVDWLPFQAADVTAYGLSADEAGRTIHLVEPTGRISHGAGAVGRLLVLSGGAYAVLGRLLLAPPVSWLAEAAYRVATALRHRLPGSTPALARLPEDRPGARPAHRP